MPLARCLLSAYTKRMEIVSSLSLFAPADAVALVLLVLLWLGIGWRIENPPVKHLSVSVLMAQYRREWMQQMVTRQPRIYDASTMANLRQGTAFFASASLISVGGILAMIGNTDQLIGVADSLTLGRDPEVVWELKLIVMLFFVANAFLKFVWSHRLFGYCSIVMSAVPNQPDDPLTQPRSLQAAELNIQAARSYNRGLRSVYFGLAAAAWLIGPLALIAAVLVTCLVLWRREFASRSRNVLLGGDAHSP